MQKIKLMLAAVIVTAMITGCSKNSTQNTQKKQTAQPTESIQKTKKILVKEDKTIKLPTPKEEKIVVFHAGSLSVPLSKLKAEYTKSHPNVNIMMEAAGSVACARKIADLKKPCDLMVSADYQVIEKILIPDYADWCIKFATNQLSVVFTPKSHFAKEINTDNWYKVLMRDKVICGASNPNEDPCGYRTVIMLQLASLFYKSPDLYKTISAQDKMIIRPKETDLIGLLEANAIDYMFIYKSVAIQHEMNHIDLPANINLGDPQYADFYKKAKIEITGKTPGSTITQIGAPIVYGVTIPKSSENREAAIEFLQFMLSNKGLKIIEDCGQKPIVPSATKSYNKIPEVLQKFAKAEL